MHFYSSMTDADWMREAYAEALSVKGKTLPNPAVGAVIVKQGKAIGKGGTQAAGQAHAEIMALREAGEAARQGILYVTLEPCCHYGRTPPCTEAIIAAGLKRVVVSHRDPNPKVAGQGVQRLREAGIEVTENVLAQEGDAFYRHFAHYIIQGRPRIILKIAQSLDGKVNERPGLCTPMTGEEAQRVTHRLRVEADAWLIGGETLRRDNPQLTPRLVHGPAPEALILSRGNARLLKAGSDGEMPLLFRQGDARKVRLIAAKRPKALPPSVLFSPLPIPSNRASARAGMKIQSSPQILRQARSSGFMAPAALMRFLHKDFLEQGYHLVVVEGGPSLWSAFLQTGAFDELWLFTAPCFFPRGQSWLRDLPRNWDKGLVFRSFTALGNDGLTVFQRG